MHPELKLDLAYKAEPNMTRDQKDLPRYAISANEAQFEMLFALEGQLGDSRAQDAVWSLIGQLKTNPKLYLSLLKNENLAGRLGRPAEVPTFKLLYYLQIIHSFLSSYGAKKAGAISLYFEPERKAYGQHGGGGW